MDYRHLKPAPCGGQRAGNLQLGPVKAGAKAAASRYNGAVPDDVSTILIVDDHPPNLLAMEAILEPLKQRVLKASSGAEALKIVLGEDCALILLDVQMPDLDGFETAALIHKRERSQFTPIIFVTAVHREEEHIIKGYAQGAVDYMVKPIERGTLQAKVRVFLSQHQRERRLEREAGERTTERDQMRGRETAALALAEERRAQLHALFMGAPAAIAILRGEEATFELANADFEALVGARDLVGKPCAQVAPGIDALVLRAQSSNKPILATEHPIGSRFFNIIVQALDTGGVGRVLFHAVESTETVLARRKLEDADRRKDEFLAMLSHELRNPLAPIVTALQLMDLREAGSDLRIERAVIERQVKQLARLVDDLLDVSRATLGKIGLRSERLEIWAAISRAIEVVSSELKARRHKLTVDVAAQGLLVHGDPVRLSQVIGNLLHNAAKYTPEGGAIEVSGRLEAGSVVVRVRDNGIGIAPDKVSSMFELFVQGEQTLDRAQGGLGVGLTLVRSLVESHGGTVEAHSEGAGRGTEVIVRLPALVEAAAQGPSKPAALPARKERRVLVIDDNRDSAAMMAEALVLVGNEVRQEHDGASALRAIREFTPEVILMDIGLPGMDGFELARRVRATDGQANVRLIAVSGYAEEARRGPESGFERFLIKPVDIQTVLDAIAEPADKTV